MQRSNLLFAAAGMAVALAAGSAHALTAKDLAGTWTVVSAGASFGPDPKGVAMFDADGHFAIELFRSNIPKYVSGLRTKGTAEEYKATVEGSIALYGTYSVSGTELLLHIESSTFPNFDSADQKRTNLTLAGDELKWTQPTPSSGGEPAPTILRRAK
jgi:hypothetical protein